MRKPNFRKAVRNNKCSGKMFAQAYPRPAGHTKYFCFNYCAVCEGCTVVSLSTKLCEYCTNNPERKPPLPSFELGAHVKFIASIGLAMQGNIAEVIGSEYVSNKRWSGWIYKLTNKTLIESIYVREIWLEVALRKIWSFNNYRRLTDGKQHISRFIDECNRFFDSDRANYPIQSASTLWN